MKIVVCAPPSGIAPSLTKTLRIMKLSFILLFATFLQVNAKGYSQISLTERNASLEKIFSHIKKQTGYAFWYEDKLLKKANPVTISVRNASLEETLQRLLKEQRLTYEIIGKTIAIKEKSAPFALPGDIAPPDAGDQKGRVVNDKGEPLEGVTVSVKGSNKATATNVNGEFLLLNIPSNATLIFSSAGYTTQSMNIAGLADIKVVMVIETKLLSDIVVTALGISREKKSIGFSAQELSKKDLTDARDINIANYLTGKIAGVQVSLPAGGVGGSSKVIIRGISSITNENQPLYVVDGIPLDNSHFNEAQIFNAGHDYGDGIGNLNPEDIESLNVLKGPNATALYGSRGSNGVIIITTKSGKTGKGIGVEVNSNVTVDKINLIPKTQNKYGPGYEDMNVYGNLVNIGGTNYETLESWHNDSYGPPMDGKLYVNPFVLDPNAAPSTFALLPQPEDNVRKFWKTGVVTNNSIALSGGNEKSSARLSFSNTTINGITPRHSENHQSVNLRVNTNITSKLSFDAKVNYMHKNVDNVPTLGSSNENYVYGLAILGRYVPLDFLSEYYDKTQKRGSFPNVAYNPYYLMNKIKNNGARDRIVSFASAKYQFTNWLTLMARSGIDVYSERRRQMYPVGARYPNTDGRLIDEEYFTKESNSDILLSANKNNLIKNFSVSVSVGASITKRNYRTQSWDAQVFKIPGIFDVSNAKNVYPFYSNVNRENQSVYVTGQIGYKNYAFLDLTGRNDWSSTLGQNNYSFFYPSVNGSFVFTDAFKMNSTVLSFGKLRASYAEAGNDASPYLTKSGYSFNAVTYNGQSSALGSNTISLFDLKNELKKSIEFGADLKFFQDRISLDATYYKSNTINQILPIQISSGSGYTTKVVNAGNIENQGIELSLNVNPIKARNGFRWDVTFNYARNHSKVKELAPGVETYLLYSSYPNNIEARVGQAFGNIIGYGYKIAPDGQRVVGTDGGYMRDDTVRILGNVTPKWIGGLSNNFSYKGFSLNVLVDFVQGNQITSSTKYQMVAKGIGAFTTRYREHSEPLPGVIEIDNGGVIKTYQKNTITVDGKTAWAGRAWGERGEEFVLNGSYIMLREVLLGYTFQPVFIKKTPFTSFRFSLVGRNLWYIEEHMQDMGISPETNLNTSAGATGVEAMSMPTTRSYGFTLNFTF